MKITKRSWFFHLLGLLALVLAFGVFFTGCDLSGITVGGGLVLGGIIGNALDHVFIGIIVGGIVGFIIFMIISLIINPRSSSSGHSTGASMGNWAQNRMNSPHTCGTCTKWLSRGVCRRDDSPKSAEDSCSNWD